MAGSVIFIIAIILFSYMYYLYISLISKKNKAFEALSSIDVQLKQRASLLPNILAIAQKYMAHEDNLFVKITELRTAVNIPYNQNEPGEVGKHLASADLLDNHISQLMLNVENYPELKSDKTMVQAMNTNAEIEAHISAARRFYNSSARELNTIVEIFPSSVVASALKIKVLPYYAADKESKVEIKAGDYL